LGRGRRQIAARLGALRNAADAGTTTPAPSGRPARGSAPPQTPATLDDGATKLASELIAGDIVVVHAGAVIPADGTVIDGMAMVDESAITGESAPVIRESGGERSAVTGGTRVISDRIVVEVT
jgi:potassium-transporting ATPase ATP-binding subunit